MYVIIYARFFNFSISLNPTILPGQSIGFFYSFSLHWSNISMLDCIECSIPAKELHKYTIQKIVQKKFEVQLMIVVRKKKNSVKLFFERDKFIYLCLF